MGSDWEYLDMDFDARMDQVRDSRWVNPDRTRDKHEWPYSYDEFFHFGSREIIKAKGVRADYSDRLWQWDCNKADRLWKEHINKRWEYAEPAKLSEFISAYHAEKLMVVALAEGCNPSNGYPYYILWYKPVG